MKTAIAVVVSGVLLLATGCSSAGVPRTAPVQRADGTILLAASAQADAAMDALISGTLTRTEEGCLAVETAEGIYVLQFPYGTLLSEDGQRVNVPGVGTLRVGDTITGGGGYLNVLGAPSECRIRDEFAIWQAVTDR